MPALDPNPRTRSQAELALITLTEQCEAIADHIKTTKSKKTLGAYVANFTVVNEARCRIVEQFNLHHFAAGLLGNGNNN